MCFVVEEYTYGKTETYDHLDICRFLFGDFSKNIIDRIYYIIYISKLNRFFLY